MLISHTQKFIFIHVPKTAGTSVMNMFLPHARLIDRLVYGGGAVSTATKVFNRVFALVPRGNRHFTGYHKHEYARVVARKMGEEAFKSHYSFAFVRNPFDWTVSRYLYICQAKGHPLHQRVSAMDFGEFVEMDVAESDYTQSDFVCDEGGNIMVDYVARFENIEAEIATIAEKLQLSPLELPHANPSKARKGKSYRDYYTAVSKELIARKFQGDLDTFGYEF